MNNENVLKPERKSLLSFLNEIKNTQFVIPVYQRNYIWQDNKQVKKFLDDYELVLKGTTESHFIGIIMFLIIQISLSKREFSVVDGQQRLITIFLFLQSLREVANETGNIDFANVFNAAVNIFKSCQNIHSFQIQIAGKEYGDIQINARKNAAVIIRGNEHLCFFGNFLILSFVNAVDHGKFNF